MKKQEIKNKETQEVLKTKTGKPLMEYTLQVGDEFIPCFNGVKERKTEAMVNGKMQTITSYYIKAIVRNKETKEVFLDDEQNNELYIKLTPSQANTLKKKLEAGEDINQHLFVVYEYDSKEHGKQVGVGYKAEQKPRKNFSDFEK